MRPPFKLGSMAPGVNNRLGPTQLATKSADGSKATYLYGADNVDINSRGYLRRRRGHVPAIGGAAHSLWGDGQGGYVVLNDELKSLTPAGAGLVAATVRAGMPRLPVSYSRGADGDVYWSNGTVLRRIHAGADLPASTPGPGVVPVVNVIAGGLRAGRYLLAFTKLGPGGESAATPVVQVEVAEGSGLTFGATNAVYMSGPNGDILTYQGDVAQVTVHTETGPRCETLNTAELPAGTIVRHFNGRMLVAAGNVLFISEPYRYGLYRPASGFIPFPAPVTVVEPTTGGVYICADKTYWATDLLGGALPELLPYGGIAGSGGRSEVDGQVFWQSPQGLIVGNASGAVKAVQSHALQLGAARSGATLFREQEGSTHVVSSRFGVEESRAVASSFMEAEIIRKGTIV